MKLKGAGSNVKTVGRIHIRKRPLQNRYEWYTVERRKFNGETWSKYCFWDLRAVGKVSNQEEEIVWIVECEELVSIVLRGEKSVYGGKWVWWQDLGFLCMRHKCINVTTGKTSVSQKPQCKDTEKLFIECSTWNSYSRSGARSDIGFKCDQHEHET